MYSYLDTKINIFYIMSNIVYIQMGHLCSRTFCCMSVYRLIVSENGRVAFQGEPGDFREPDAFFAVRLGVPGKKKRPDRCRQDAFSIETDQRCWSIRITFPSGSVIIKLAGPEVFSSASGAILNPFLFSSC